MAGLERFPVLNDEDLDFKTHGIRNIPARRLPPSHLNIKPFVVQSQIVEDDFDEEYRAAIRRYVEMGVCFATLITENLLSHPFVVLRRQCQVQPGSRRWHMTPFTLIPVVVRLHQRQGVSCLWKGLGSSLLVRGLVLACEDLLSKFTPWPKEMPASCAFKSVGQHLMLKGLSLAIVTPFYSASFVETVQSDIASEKPGLTDVIREGLCRCVSVGSARGRMLPVWALIGPTVAHGLLKYLIALGIRTAAAWTIHMRIRADQVRKGAIHKNIHSEENRQQVEVTAAFIGMVSAEVLCFPLETILHRLHLQGTRTIVDQLDNGTEVVPILTAYSGAADCYVDAVGSEGFAGLYRGFGALIVQIAVHWAVIRLTRFVIAKGASLFHPPPPPKIVPVPAASHPQGDAAGNWRDTQTHSQMDWGAAAAGYSSSKDRSMPDAYFSTDHWSPNVTSTPVSTPMSGFIPRRPDSQ